MADTQRQKEKKNHARVGVDMRPYFPGIQKRQYGQKKKKIVASNEGQQSMFSQ